MHIIRTLLLTVAVSTMIACTHKNRQIAMPETEGCLDSTALNYTPDVTRSNPTLCKYAIDSVTGIYDVTDTFIWFTGMGPDTAISNMPITLTRHSATALLFDTLLKCATCAGGGIPYNNEFHVFSYTSYSDPYTANSGQGYIIGNTIQYKQIIYSSMSSYTPSHRGRGTKR